MFEYQVYPSIGCAEFKSIGNCIEFSCYLRNFRIHIETGLRYSAFGEVLSQINDCIYRFAREQFGCFEYFTERTDYRVEFKFFRVAHKGLYGRSREQFRDLFKHAVYICVGCAEFESIGYRVEFSCYLRDFRIHVKLGFAYDTVNKVLCQIYDRIDGFARKNFGRFNYFARRADYGIEFEFFRIVYESLNRRGREQYGYLFKYTFNVCGSCAEFKPVGYRVKFSCYLRNFRVHIETGLTYSAFGEVLSKVYDCINSFFGE